MSRSLSDFGSIGCKSAAAVHFLPAFCHIAGLCACKSGKNYPRWDPFSLSMPKARQAPGSQQRGFTLIELIIFIVVVSAGLAGILSVMNSVVKSSADPIVRKQAMAMAESILEEIVQKEYSDPDGTSGETTRATMDDVDDYNGKTAAEIQTLFADSLAQVPGYTIAIVVDSAAPLFGVDMKKITVTVNRGSESISLSGYRANY